MMLDDRFDGTVSGFLQQRAGTGDSYYLDDILGWHAPVRGSDRAGSPSKGGAFDSTSVQTGTVLAVPVPDARPRPVRDHRAPARGRGRRGCRVAAAARARTVRTRCKMAAIAYSVADGDIHVIDAADRHHVDRSSTGPGRRRDTGLLARTGSKFLFAARSRWTAGPESSA